MLFLLRQIRRKLLTENKITTYLLYAMGEIILVVIGILIAVSIDDWNEARINKKKEHDYLVRIKEEAKWNIDVLNAQVQEYEANSNNLESIAHLLSVEAPQNVSPEIPVAPYFIGAWMLKTSVYTELVSSGSMSLISDVKLREMMDEAASMEIIATQALEYWRGMSLEDVNVFRPYLIPLESKDSVESMTLDYIRMKEDTEAIGSLRFWSSANHKFGLGIDDFKGHYQRILDRIICLESKSCKN